MVLPLSQVKSHIYFNKLFCEHGTVRWPSARNAAELFDVFGPLVGLENNCQGETVVFSGIIFDLFSNI